MPNEHESIGVPIVFLLVTDDVNDVSRSTVLQAAIGKGEAGLHLIER